MLAILGGAIIGGAIVGSAIIGSARRLRMPAADGDKSAMIVIFLFEGACNGNERDLFLYLMLVTREWY